jgi:MHS family proline/betaine transporter-like MFS transporter
VSGVLPRTGPTFLEDNVTAVGGTAVDSSTSSWMQIGVLWGAVLVIPFLGMLSERIGRKPRCSTPARSD